MPRTYYFWDIDSAQQKQVLDGPPTARLMEKLRAKFGHGPIVAVGDENRLNEAGNAAVGIKTVPYSKFIHVPYGQRTTAIKILLEKMREVIWARKDILVMISTDSALGIGVTKVKVKGVVVNIIGNRLNGLYISLHGTHGGRCYIFQWSEVLS